MPVTIKDIAKAAGVSRGTVDRVLHNRPGVNAQVAQEIRALAQKMGFVPNRAGKVLAARKQQIKFGCLLPAKSIPFFDDVIKGFERAQRELADYGVSVEIVHASRYDTETHIKAIQEMAKKDYSGLCVTTLDTPQVQLEVNKIAQKIPVVSVNTDVPDSGRICYVGVDYFRSGLAAAGMLNLIHPQELNALIIAGSYNIRGHKERIKGFLAGLDAHKIAYSICGKIESLDSDEVAYQETLTALKKDTSINCIFIAAAGVGGVCRAVQDCGKEKIRVLAFDTVPQVTQYLNSGLIDFTIDQEPEMQGYMGIQRLFSWLMEEGKREAKDYITNTVIKIAENID
ncbi:MAG: LacI family DNA-binding transcriptional regulator [Treponema sp.]|nr:LacI family DNA-binding transcriptional regulator [Treponema sp.]